MAVHPIRNGSIASIALAGLHPVMGMISDIPIPKPRGRMIERLADSTCSAATPHGACAKKPRHNAHGFEICRASCVLTFKFVGENRSRPKHEDTSVQEMDAHDYSLFPETVPSYPISSLLIFVG